MAIRRYKPEQIVNLLRQIEVGIANGKPTPQACKEAEITVQTYYRWRKEYGSLKLRGQESGWGAAIFVLAVSRGAAGGTSAARTVSARAFVLTIRQVPSDTSLAKVVRISRSLLLQSRPVRSDYSRIGRTA
jgi:hypothetical protein